MTCNGIAGGGDFAISGAHSRSDVKSSDYDADYSTSNNYRKRMMDISIHMVPNPNETTAYRQDVGSTEGGFNA